MATKAQVVELVEQGQAEMLQLAASLTDEERARSGTLQNWSSRDVLAHLAFWKRHLARRIAAARQGRDQAPSEDELKTNDRIFQQYEREAWETIESLLRGSHQEMLEQMEALSEEDLNIPGRFPTLGEAPLWREIAGNSYSHPIVHLGTAYIERGEQAYANGMWGRVEALVSAMDDLPDWQAVSRYNLACHWALGGEPQKALALLPFAFRHRPDLIAWAPQDTDLVSLHGTPEFEALLEQARKEQESD